MKRKDPLDSTINQVYKTYPLFFWKKCELCKLQFRREWGWKFWEIAHQWGNVYIYFCKSCCPTKEKTATIIDNRRNESEQKKKYLLSTLFRVFTK